MNRSAPRPETPHIPVLLQEMLELMAPEKEETHLDATFGAGGYSRALLERAPCRVVAMDRDPAVLPTAEGMAAAFAGRFTFVSGAFGQMDSLLPEAGIAQLHGIVMDIGVSSMQIDEAVRGFSFQKDGPLDMRMAQAGASAREVVNQVREEELADIIFHYGEEKAARKVARAIVMARAEKPIERTLELAEIVRKAAAKYYGNSKKSIDPATRTFQALRIYVNDELGELERALHASVRLLAPGGRLVVVTFHSLEDRMVKRFFADMAGKHAGASRHAPQQAQQPKAPDFRLLTAKPVVAGAQEAAGNPRARSAKLRALCREGRAA